MKRKSILTLIAAVVILAVVIAGAFATANNPVTEDSPSRMFSTFWALIPPIVAIALALITKEVYSSLFVGVVLGGLMASNFSFAGTVDAVVNDGLIASVADSAGIFVFLVILGIIVALVNRAGGSQAFGRWASSHIRTKVGAALATFLLGVLIFIDDYFNCLTVGSVMRPLTDEKKISRVKLAYLIDATAAPVCMIAPISSWAAAVSGCVESETYSGLQLFVKAIPFNFYSLLTFVFIITISIMGFDYGKMADFEIRAQGGDIVGNTDDIASNDEKPLTDRGRVIDLVLPVVILIITCVLGLLYVGGYFGGDYAGDFIGAFGNTDAYVGLPWGGIIALIIIVAYMLLRRVLSFKEAMQCVPQGFIAMVPPILILTLATSLKNIPACRHLRGCLCPQLCHRHLLGHLRYSDPHRHQHLPRDEPPAVRGRVRLSGGRGLRRPLLPHLRYHHHVLRRRPVQPCGPCGHTAAVCADSGGAELRVLYHCGLPAQCLGGAAHRCGDDRPHPPAAETDPEFEAGAARQRVRIHHAIRPCYPQQGRIFCKQVKRFRSKRRLSW